MAPAPDQRSRAALSILVTVLAVVLAVVAGAALWRIGSGLQKQACVAKAEAQYPGVPVSALNGTKTGPLKLSYALERQQAVKGC